jgi:TRAP-type C4-dicarboxylate transport system permease large subunit
VWDAVSHGEDSLVRVVFQGHYHPGRLAHVRTAPVVTLAAMVEGAPPSTAFAIADIESEAVSIAGYGRQHSAQILMAECAMVD